MFLFSTKHLQSVIVYIDLQWFEDHLDTMNRKFYNALEDRDEKAKKKLGVLGDLFTCITLTLHLFKTNAYFHFL